MTPRHTVVISDTHFGCRLALCPPAGAKLDDGGVYLPSKAQLVLWSWWEEFWNEFVPLHTRGEPYDIVHNGDAVEGEHHRATTQISHNLLDQNRLAKEALAPRIAACKKKGGRYFHIRGTPAHVGESARDEEKLAEELGAAPNSEGQYARWELWKKMGKNRLVHFSHHIGTTSSSAHESSAVNAELIAAFVEAARWGEQPPDMIVRSHRHANIAVTIPTARGPAKSVVTPAWQLKTPFCYKIAGARQKPPQLGGLIIRVADDGTLETRDFVKSISRAKPE